MILSMLIFNIALAQKLDIDRVDNSSYKGKAMFGYQGWFGHPDDNSPRPNYWHWGNMDNVSIYNLNVDMYPDLREYCASERYETAYTLPNGEIAPVYSAGNRASVKRHMKWVRDYNTDGVWVQRFISEYNDRVVMAFRDSTTVFVKEGCEEYGRVFAIMYDGIAGRVNNIKTDWKHLVDNLELTDSDSYLFHNNRPIVALWGYTVRDDAKVEELEELLDFFHNNEDPKYRASVKLGVNDNFWKKGTSWSNALSKADVISPWSVGRFGDQSGYNSYLVNQLRPGKAWCEQRGILYVPVLFPGFSWHNLRNGNHPQNHIPRDGGNFFWLQAYGAVKENVESMYFAMLDEVDESTAFYKLAETKSDAPAQQYWLTLDADGYDLPADWYLRCAGQAAEALRGNFSNTPSLGTPKHGIMSILPGIDNCNLTFVFPKHEDVSLLEISIDGAESFPYSVAADAGSFVISGLEKGIYDVYVRDTYSIGEPVPMGKVCVSSGCVGTSAEDIENSDFGNIRIYPNPSSGIVQIEGLSVDCKVDILKTDGSKIRSFDLSGSGQNKTIDISALPDALYFISVKSGKGNFTAKLNKTGL
jgi:hypothetical protein